MSLICWSGKLQEDWLHAEDSLKEGIHFYVKVSLYLCGGTVEPRF